MDKAGLILDVTHLADESFWDALEIFNGPVLASHHNSRTLVPGDRQLNDDQIKELIKRDAVIGASFDCWMIQPDWKIGVSDPSTVTMEDIATTPITSANSPATRSTVAWGPTSTAATAKSRRQATWIRSPTCKTSPASSNAAATRPTTSPASCTATSSTCCGGRGVDAALVAFSRLSA